MRAKARAVEQNPQRDQNADHPQRLNGNAEEVFAQQGVHLRILVGGQRHAGAVHQHEFEPAIEK